MRYKVAIIGTGKIAGLFDSPQNKDGIFTHAQACSKLRNIYLEAACDKNLKRLNKFCRVWGVKDKYRDVHELLNKKKLDIILLCTPNHTHFSLARDILRHPHRPQILLVEKPICLNKTELFWMSKILENCNTKLIVNHKYRFQSGLEKIIALIKNGTLGKPLSIRVVYYGGLFNNGVHVLDTLRMVTGSEFRIISAKIGASGPKQDFCVDAELLLKEHPKVKISIESFEEKYYQLYEMEIRLAFGRIRIMDFGERIFIDKALTNNLAEKELKNIAQIPMSRNDSPLMNLFKKIIAYLDHGDVSILSAVGIKEAAKTMVSLWEIKDKALRWQN